MTRLPGPRAKRAATEKATAQTTPSRSTIVAHMWLFSPLFSSAVALSSALLSAAWLGSAAQPFAARADAAPRPLVCAPAAAATHIIAATAAPCQFSRCVIVVSSALLQRIKERHDLQDLLLREAIPE